MLQQTCSVIAGAIYAIGFAVYIHAIVYHNRHPAKASWLVWAVLDTILFFGMRDAHALNGQMRVAVVGNWAMVIVLMKYGKAGWTFTDKICLASAGVILILWCISKSSWFGIGAPIVIIALGSIPTFKNTSEDISCEPPLTWLLWLISGIFMIPGVPSWHIEAIAQPITFLLGPLVMFCVLWDEPWFKNRAVSDK